MKKIIVIVIVTLCTACSAQKTNPMRTFDIEVFNENKNHLDEYDFNLEGGIKVSQRKDIDEYYETIQSDNSYFQTINRYYLNGKLKATVKDFPNNFFHGTYKEYDEEGNLIKETDYDKEFEFTWEQLLKLLEERNVDIRDADNTTIRKQNGNWRFDYIQDIYIYDVIIHGKTGEVLQDAKNVFQEGS